MAGERPVVVILGPTAVGKTGLAVALAQALDSEIVSADSRQVYRYMDIGTAKPTPAERAQATHHLIDIVAPDESLSLAEYQRAAYAHLDRLHALGKVPLLVGGTGQYLSAVIEGWSIPQVAPNPALRAELEAYAAEHGSQALHDRLRTLDPEAAHRIEHQNIRRVVRALEVCLETGRPITELQRKSPPPYAIHEIGLTMPRDTLYAQADRRFDEMMARGLLDEVRHLLDMGYDRALPAMSGIGYAQLCAHLLDGQPLAESVSASKRLTHDFIRRQYTWFRKYNPAIMWHNVQQVTHQALIDSCLRWVKERA